MLTRWPHVRITDLRRNLSPRCNDDWRGNFARQAKNGEIERRQSADKPISAPKSANTHGDRAKFGVLMYCLRVIILIYLFRKHGKGDEG